MKQFCLLTCTVLVAIQDVAMAQAIVEHGTSKTVWSGESGKLEYSKDINGNRLPDFSHVGYHSGEKAIPMVPVKATLAPKPNGDDTARIQAALDGIGKLPLDKNGLRGTRATVQDCVSLGHASRVTGARRYPFCISGQLNLVQRCITYDGRHEYVNGARVPGPNVFVDCIGYRTRQLVGPHHRYATGTLYDNVSSEMRMESRFRGNSGSGHGWAASQTCFWNCVSPGVMLGSPPGGIVWSIGSGKDVPVPDLHKDLKQPGEYKWVLGTVKSRFNFVYSTGTIESPGVIRVMPGSLYYQQVKDRLGQKAVDRLTNQENLKNMGRYPWVKELLATVPAE